MFDDSSNKNVQFFRFFSSNVVKLLSLDNNADLSLVFCLISMDVSVHTEDISLLLNIFFISLSFSSINFAVHYHVFYPDRIWLSFKFLVQKHVFIENLKKMKLACKFYSLMIKNSCSLSKISFFLLYYFWHAISFFWGFLVDCCVKPEMCFYILLNGSFIIFLHSN